MDFLMNLWRDDEGQALTEYGLILALIAVVVIGTIALIGGQLEIAFKSILDKLTNANADG